VELAGPRGARGFQAEGPVSAVLGVVLPCLDEAAVIERKLANLALLRWPAKAPGAGPHRIAVVDDHSNDGTAARARDAAEKHFAGRADVIVDVIANAVRPGKPGAVATGIEHLEERVGLIVLTDADVVLAPDALVALAAAFAADAGLAMASGAQRFVRDLAGDGTPRSAILLPVQDASEPFDRWTARVRRLESRSGRLFSVHGQLLAWLSDLRLRPRAGIAADDLDLMLQVRSGDRGPRRVVLVPAAEFLEVKTPAGPARRNQALRRARAYVQLVRKGPALASDPISRAQWAFYRWLPLATPALLLAVPMAGVLLFGILFGGGGALAAALLVLLVLTSPPGWRLAKLASRIREALRLEARASISERWETERWTAIRP